MNPNNSKIEIGDVVKISPEPKKRTASQFYSSSFFSDTAEIVDVVALTSVVTFRKGVVYSIDETNKTARVWADDAGTDMDKIEEVPFSRLSILRKS